jgi:hypothetical protein
MISFGDEIRHIEPVFYRISLSRIYFCNIHPLLTLPRLNFSPCQSFVPYLNRGILILSSSKFNRSVFLHYCLSSFGTLSRGMIHRTFSPSDVKTPSSNSTCRAPQYFVSSPLNLVLLLFVYQGPVPSPAAHIRNLGRVLLPKSVFTRILLWDGDI